MLIILLINAVSFNFISSEYIPRNIRENNKFKISAEEIQRRRKLVEPYLLKIEEVQKVWIEAYEKNINPKIYSYKHDEILETYSNKQFQEKIESISESRKVDSSLPETVETKQGKTENVFKKSENVDSEEKKIISEEIFPPNKIGDFLSEELIESEKSNPERDHSRIQIENQDHFMSDRAELRTSKSPIPIPIEIENINQLNTDDLPEDIHEGNDMNSENNVEKFQDNIEEQLNILSNSINKVSILPNKNVDDISELKKDVFQTESYFVNDNDKISHQIDEKLLNFENQVRKNKDKASCEFSKNKNCDKTGKNISKRNKEKIGYKSQNNENIRENSKFEISAEEIQRRRKLVDPYLLKIEEQNDWIEMYEKNINPKSYKDDEMLETYSNKQFQEKIESTSKNGKVDSSDRKLSVSEILLQRKKLIEPYIASLNEKTKDFKETYDFFNREMEPVETLYLKSSNQHINNCNTQNLENERNKLTSETFKKIKSLDRRYVMYWLKKVLKKLVNFQNSQQVTISFTFTSQNVKDIEDIVASEKFDFHSADELVSDLISNATIHNIHGYNLSGFSTITFYVTLGIVTLVSLYFILLYYPLFRIILCIFICIVWHGYKMYQQNLAEKHATVSASSPQYCESILVKESGFWAHIKESFRHFYHNEECEKYYKALMVDPLSELSLSIVISDLVSSTVFQVLLPMSDAMNKFIQGLFKGLSLFQTFCLFVLIIFLLIFLILYCLIYNKYKLKFPFFLGSIEPTSIPVGSRVEDLAPIKEPKTKNEYSIKYYFSNKYNISVLPSAKESIDFKPLPKIENSKHSVRRSSI